MILKYNEMLERFYQKHEPAKIGGVHAIIHEYVVNGGVQGHGSGIDQLNALLLEKYGENLNSKDILFSFHSFDETATTVAARNKAKDEAQAAAKAAAMAQLRGGMLKLDKMESIDETRRSKHKSKGRTFAALQAKRAARGQATDGVRGRGASLGK